MIVPGFWSDVVHTPAGFRFLVHDFEYGVKVLDEDGKLLHRHQSPEGFWFLRAAALPDGTIGVVGQGHKTPGMQFMVIRPDGTDLMRQYPDPHVGAQNGVVIKANGADAWELAVQFEPRRWRMVWVTRDGTLSIGAPQNLPTWPGGDGSSSQGFLYWQGANPVFSDPNRFVTVNGQGTLLSMVAENGVRVGQSQSSNGLLVFMPNGRFGLYEPQHAAFEPHVVSHGDRFAVATRSLNGLAIIGVLSESSPLSPIPVTPPPPPPPPPPTEVPGMKLSTAAKEVIFRFAAKFPIPTNGDDPSREWTHKMAQQLAFSLPADGWGHKSAGGGRPHSADVVALRTPFIGWDIIGGSGAPGAVLQLENDSIDLSGQVFEEVTPFDHIGGSVTPPPPPPPPPASDPNLTVIALESLAELQKQTALLTAMATGLAALPAQLEASIGALKASFDKGVKIRF